jgi:phosphoribosyl-dephospho-CoA transferase
MTASPLQRHRVVYCSSAQFDGAFLAGATDDISLASAWIEAGRPLIARMRHENDPAESVALGLPLPLDQGKKRIALAVRPSFVVRIEEPPCLDDVIAVVPSEWQDRLSMVSDELRPHAQSVRVIGSAAWQFLTGLTYLHPRSDIDLVIRVMSGTSLQPVLDGLIKTDSVPGPRLDGEIVLPDGEAVSWRELCKPAEDILVKTLNGPRVRPRPEWLNKLQASAA